MKIREGVDMGKAFDELKKSLIAAEEKVKSEEEYKYPYAYGMLSAAVKGFLFVNSDAPSYDSITEPETNPDTLTSKTIEQ